MSAPVVNRGREADSPLQIPARGWLDVARRVKEEAKQDDVSLLGGGVAFFGLLALVPALVALVSLYGLFASEAAVTDQVGRPPTCQSGANRITEEVPQQNAAPHASLEAITTSKK